MLKEPGAESSCVYSLARQRQCIPAEPRGRRAYFPLREIRVPEVQDSSPVTEPTACAGILWAHTWDLGATGRDTNMQIILLLAIPRVIKSYSQPRSLTSCAEDP